MTSNNIAVQLNYDESPWGRVWATDLSIQHDLAQASLRQVNDVQRLISRGKSKKSITLNGLVDRELVFNYFSNGRFTQPWQVWAGSNRHQHVYMDSMSVSVAHNGTPKISVNGTAYDEGLVGVPNTAGSDPTTVSWMKGYEFTITDSGSMLNNVAELTYSLQWDWLDVTPMGAVPSSDPAVILQGMTQQLDIVTTGLATGYFPDHVGRIYGDIIVGNTTQPAKNIHFTATGSRIDSQSYEIGDVMTTRTTLREIIY